MLMLNLGSRKRGRPSANRRTRTRLTLSAEDLAVLAELIAAGQALLLVTGPATPVVSRLKAAMTRLQLPIPHGM
jgi:hypothetical protein